MAYKQIRHKKIYEIVAENIQEMIQDKQLRAGDKLDSVEQLAKQFDVGRSAVREALSALRAIGLIEIRQGEGTFVRSIDSHKLHLPVRTEQKMTFADMRNFFEVRKVIESGTAAIAAAKRTDQDLQTMQDALQHMQHAIGNEDLGEKADARFHLAIAAATQNDTLEQLMNQIADTLYDSMAESRRIWLFAKEAAFEQLYREHLAIYEAIAAQNEPLAEKQMIDHLNGVERVLLHYDEQRPSPE